MPFNHPAVRVTKLVSDDGKFDALHRHLAGMGVPQRVKTCVLGDTGFFQCSFKWPLLMRMFPGSPFSFLKISSSGFFSAQASSKN